LRESGQLECYEQESITAEAMWATGITKTMGKMARDNTWRDTMHTGIQRVTDKEFNSVSINSYVLQRAIKKFARQASGREWRVSPP